MNRDHNPPQIPWLGLAVAVAPCLVLAALILHGGGAILPELRPDRPGIERSFAVVTAAHALDRAIEDAGRAERGFLITGDARYLDTFGRRAAQADARLAALARLTDGEPEQRRRLTLLRQQAAAEFGKLKATIATRQSAGFEAARKIVADDAGFDATGVIGGVLDSIADAERAGIDAQRRRARLRDAEAALAGVVAAGLAVAVALSGGSLAAAAFMRLSRAQSRLRDSEERFRLLVSRVRDCAIFMLDPVGRIVSWNDGAERIEGYTAAEVIGRRVSCLYPEDAVAARAPERHLQSASAEGSCAADGWRVRKDGSRFWADAEVTAVHGPDGRLRGFAGILRDMTEHRAAPPLQPDPAALRG